MRDCSARCCDSTDESGRVGEAGGILAPTQRVFVALDVQPIGADHRGDGNGPTWLDRVACSIDCQKYGALERLSRCDRGYVSGRIMGRLGATPWYVQYILPAFFAGALLVLLEFWAKAALGSLVISQGFDRSTRWDLQGELCSCQDGV